MNRLNFFRLFVATLAIALLTGLFSKNAAAQTAAETEIDVSLSTIPANFCNAAVTYTIISDGLEISPVTVQESDGAATDYAATLILPAGFPCSYHIRAEVDAFDCDTGQPCRSTIDFDKQTVEGCTETTPVDSTALATLQCLEDLKALQAAANDLQVEANLLLEANNDLLEKEIDYTQTTHNICAFGENVLVTTQYENGEVVEVIYTSVSGKVIPQPRAFTQGECCCTDSRIKLATATKTAQAKIFEARTNVSGIASPAQVEGGTHIKIATGRYRVVFATPQTPGTYRSIVELDEPTNTRDMLDVAIDISNETAAGFEYCIKTGDNGGNPDVYDDEIHRITVFADCEVLSDVRLETAFLNEEN